MEIKSNSENTFKLVYVFDVSIALQYSPDIPYFLYPLFLNNYADLYVKYEGEGRCFDEKCEEKRSVNVTRRCL